MAFAKNTKKEVKKRVGLHTIIPLAVNPTSEQLVKYFPNTNTENETEYIKEKTDDGGEKYYQLQVKVVFKTKEDPNYIDSFSIFLDSRIRFSGNTSKTQFINNQGQTIWTFKAEDAADIENHAERRRKWIDVESFRSTFKGEETIINMIKAARNIKATEEAYFENPEKLFRGDISEIRSAIIDTDDLTGKPLAFKALLGVDGKFIRVYDKVFLEAAEIDTSWLKNSLDRDSEAGYAFKANYPEDLKPTQYDPLDYGSGSTTSARGGSTTSEDDDLPF